MIDDIDNLAAEFGITREEMIAIREEDTRLQAERDVRGNCGTCRHYDLNPDAGVRYFGHPEPDIGFCKLSGGCNQSRTIMGSGDWCEQFERKEQS